MGEVYLRRRNQQGMTQAKVPIAPASAPDVHRQDAARLHVIRVLPDDEDRPRSLQKLHRALADPQRRWRVLG